MWIGTRRYWSAGRALEAKLAECDAAWGRGDWSEHRRLVREANGLHEEFAAATLREMDLGFRLILGCVAVIALSIVIRVFLG